jgi:hypothetical protein
MDKSKKNTKNLVFETTETQLNTETGEMISHKKTKSVILEKEPEFVKLYLGDIIRLKDLPKGTDKILYALLQTMGYNNVIPAFAAIKRMIIRDLGISINTLNKGIDTLHKKGVLIRIERGIYMADPELFGKGSWAQIKDLRLNIEYNPKTGKRTLKSNARQQLQLTLDA